MAARGRGLFSLYINIENFRKHLVRSHWTNFNIILQKCSFGDPLPRLFKPFGFVKKHGRQGQGLFTLYISIENFKNLLVRNHWTPFNIILQKCSFGDPLPRLFKPFGFVKKHGHQGAGLIFPINHWTDFHIILQKCSFGDPLPRLFKPFGFIKNMATRGRGLFSLYNLYRKIKNLLVRNHTTDFNKILQKCDFGDPLPRLFKTFGFVKKHGRQGAGLIFPLHLYRKL